MRTDLTLLRKPNETTFLRFVTLLFTTAVHFAILHYIIQLHYVVRENLEGYLWFYYFLTFPLVVAGVYKFVIRRIEIYQRKKQRRHS